MSESIYISELLQGRLQFSPETVRHVLDSLSDQELREELKRRANLRKRDKDSVLRCRHCKHCIQGFTDKSKAWRGYETTVCALKPKLEGHYYYSTLSSRKACENIELKSDEI